MTAPTYTFTESDIGCHADGAFGHDHCREVLADLLETFEDTNPFARTEFTGKFAAQEVVNSLAGPMPDDAWDEYEALEILNDATEPGCGLCWQFHESDLVLWQQPDPDDWIIQHDGTVTQWESSHCATPPFDEGGPMAFIRARMKDDQFWPNVWTLSDHGNLSLVRADD